MGIRTVNKIATQDNFDDAMNSSLFKNEFEALGGAAECSANDKKGHVVSGLFQASVNHRQIHRYRGTHTVQ